MLPPAEVERRRALVPVVSYPDELPVSQRRDDIAAAIRDHQVVIVAGETGSGKTTQLPKICLELGRGVHGMIGHTQPRRIAARSVAERVAEEIGTPLGETVGYQVRFTDHSSRDTLVKLMTDGILLAELQHDRMLSAYDTIIIDEAHERSLNVDFLLGYLKQLLPRRPDLKVVITSATIDPQRFSRHFDDAPVIEVSGRTYPVEVRYRPLVEESGLRRRGRVAGPRPDRGDRGRRQGAGARGPRRHPGLPARRAGDPRHRRRPGQADHPARGRLRRRAAVRPALLGGAAPGVRAAQPAPGRARHQRRRDVADGPRHPVRRGRRRGPDLPVSVRTKVQRLPIEPVSQASANQRSGRCGRVEAGICIRLYSEEDYESRPEFTDPEILRTNLASVILSMTALGLGDVGRFPFVDPPDQRNVRAGVQLLEELGALVADGSAGRGTPG